ncbi:MAG: alpha/beta fold hydrolase [Myxococcota bacterium]
MDDGVVPEVPALVAHAVADPVRAERDFAAFGSAERMWQMVVAGSGDTDRAVYTHPGFAPHFRRALAESFARGSGGYARDTVLAMGRWPFDPGAIVVPVHLWYGARDTSPVHAPDLGERLAARIPGARRTVVADEGGAILWTRAGEILAALVGDRPK